MARRRRRRPSVTCLPAMCQIAVSGHAQVFEGGRLRLLANCRPLWRLPRIRATQCRGPQLLLYERPKIDANLQNRSAAQDLIHSRSVIIQYQCKDRFKVD